MPARSATSPIGIRGATSLILPARLTSTQLQAQAYRHDPIAISRPSPARQTTHHVSRPSSREKVEPAAR
jgi:hypothetical protein